MTPLIITGMHRSGTSAVARLAQRLGCDLGSHLLDAGDGNRHGHFEEAAFIAFHDSLIARFYQDRAPFCEWLPLGAAPVGYTGADRATARRLWEDHAAAGGRGWKDPRTSLFLDLWLELLPAAKVVVCLRHPYQVHLSLLRRGEPFLHANYSSALRGWGVYAERVRQSLAAVAPDRILVVDVDTAFREPEALSQRLAAFLGVEPPIGAAEAITPEDFHFEAGLDRALDSFPAAFPALAELHSHLGGPHPGGPLPATTESDWPESHLVDFEERHGLRAMTRAMLVRSIEADRARYVQINRLQAEADVEKDRLIDDLSRLNGLLKAEVVRLRAVQTPMAPASAPRYPAP